MTTDFNSNGLPAAAPVVRLVDELHKLPGIGAKNAQRLTYHLVRMPAREAKALAEAILAVKDLVSLCVHCQNITDRNPCPLCANPSRDHTTICVVEEPLDVLAVERSNAYRGLYHVLHGAVSPMNGIGPDELKMAELIDRLKAGAGGAGGGEAVREVILATNSNMAGEATAMYLYRLLEPLGVRVTRLARGLPTGAELEYADETTISRAFEGRQDFF